MCKVKFLGILIDSHLTWKEHVNNICFKISRVIGVLNRLKSILPLQILVNLYNTMILPYLTYCNIIWGNCASYLLQRLFLLQKRAIRVITKSFYLAHTDQLFYKLKILKIHDLYRLQVASFMFSYSKNILPEHFNEFFVLNSSVNNYSTRNSNKLYIPFYRYNFSRTLVRYQGPITWNNLSNELKCCHTLQCFKRNYKMTLINAIPH